MTAADIVVADGHPREALDTWPLRHLKLPAASADSGDTPRRIAGELADASGYDAVLMRPDTDLGRIVAWHARLPAEQRLALDRRYGFSVSAFVAELDAASRS